MFASILIIIGLALVVIGIIGLVVTTVQNINGNDNSVKNQVNTIITGAIFFFGTLLAAAGGFLLM
jgi:hypothetical protein